MPAKRRTQGDAMKTAKFLIPLLLIPALLVAQTQGGATVGDDARTAAADGKAVTPTRTAASAKAEDPYESALALLGRISASKPEVQLLASLFQLRSNMDDPEIVGLLGKFVASGMIASRQSTAYLRRVRPYLKDAAELEASMMLKCSTCDGTGGIYVRCEKCGGSGLCGTCGGTGKIKYNASLTTFKKPTQAHSKPQDEIKEIPCKTCKGTGACPSCGKEGKRKRFCETCAGGGKVWDMAAVNAASTTAYDDLMGALRIKVHGERVAKSVVRIKSGDEAFTGPAFIFADKRVVAIPARRIVGVDAITLHASDRSPLIVDSMFAAKACDLVLLEIGETVHVTPLALEATPSMMDEGNSIMAYGLSRELGSVTKLSGKITALGSQYVATNVDSDGLADGALLLTGSGSIGAIFMCPIVEFNALGVMSLAQRNGMALRLDNLFPDDFVKISTEDHKARNAMIMEGRSAIAAAVDLLSESLEALAKRKGDISDAIKRLDTAIETLRGVRKWEVFTMAETAKEIVQDAEIRARNLEAKLVAVNEAEAEAKRVEAERVAAEKEAAETTVIEAEEAPAITDDDQAAKAAAIAAARKASANARSAGGKPTPPLQKDSGETVRMVIYIVVAAIVVITLLFLLIGKVMDDKRKKRAATPGVIPKFVRDMKKR